MSLAKVNQSPIKYRLGDAILLHNSAHKKMRNYPNTIGHDYLAAINWAPKLFNKDILTRVINKHIKEHNYKAPKTEWVLHWRLYPKVQIPDIEEINKLINGEEITVCAAIHSRETTGIEELNKFISQDNVELQSSSNVDEDFCFAFQAKKLIVTRGNFGRLLCKVRNNLTLSL
jgi:hypothetical protein